MKKHVLSGWKALLVVVVVLELVFSAQAREPAPASQAVTLCATVREPSGTTGTVAFTFALEELPAASAVLPNTSTRPPQPSAIPEPATLALLGLGVRADARAKRMESTLNRSIARQHYRWNPSLTHRFYPASE